MATGPRIRYDIEARASGASQVEQLAQEFEKLDGAFPEDLAGKVRNASQQLEQLGDQQEAVETFRRIRDETEKAKKEFDAAKLAVEKLAGEIAQAEAPTRAQAGQLEKLRDKVKAANKEFEDQSAKLGTARQALTEFGVSAELVDRRSELLKRQISSVKTEIAGLASAGASGAGFQTLMRETDAARQRMEEAARAADALAAELQGVQRPTDGEAAKLRLLRTAADTARSDFERLQHATVEQALALRRAGVNTEFLTAKTREAAAAQQQAAAATQRTAAALREQAVAATAATSNLKPAIDGITAGFGRLGAAAAAALTGREFIDTITQAESLRRGLAAVSGSTEVAGRQLEFLKLKSNELGIDVQAAGRAFLSLTAATQGTALEGDATRQVFEAVSRAMSTLGKSSAETERALLAVGQMASKGKVSMEELRGQLGEALPGALTAAAKGAGLTTQQLISMVESGNVLAKDLLPALTKGLNDLYANQGPPETLTANWNRLKNVITETAVQLAEGGVGQGLTKAVGGAAVALAAVDEAVTNVAKDMGEFAGAVVTGNFELGTQAERIAASEARLKSLSQTAGLASADVAKIGDAAGAAGETANQAFRKFEHGAEAAALASESMGKGTVDLALNFDTLRLKGDTAAEAIAKIGKGFDFSTAPGIKQAEDVLNRLAITGKLTADEVKKAWADALRGQDLAEFESRARAAFEGTAGEARKLGTVLDAIDEESLRRVGTSVEELRTGFSDTFTDAMENVDAVARTLDRLGVSGEKAGSLLSKSLDQATNAANTEEAIQAVIDRLEKMGKAGQLSGDQVAEGLTKARAKMDELKPGINSTEEAYRKLGITSQAVAKKTADEFGAAYKTIAADAQSSIGKKIEAFNKWATAAKEANGGVETSEIKLQREILNTQAKAAGLGDVFVDSMQRTKVATDAAAESLNRLATSASSAYDEATKARKAADLSVLGNVDSSGFTLGPDGQRFTVSRQIDVPDGYTFDNAAFQRAQRNAALTGGPAPDPANFYVAPSPGLLEITDESAAEQGLIRNGSAGYSPLGANRQQAELQRRAAEADRIARQNAAARAAASGATTTNVQIVRLQIGSSSTDVRVSSAADASALTSFMDQLAAAARSAGINISG